jgi:hypothetical protein
MPSSGRTLGKLLEQTICGGHDERKGHADVAPCRGEVTRGHRLEQRQQLLVQLVAEKGLGTKVSLAFQLKCGNSDK